MKLPLGNTVPAISANLSNTIFAIYGGKFDGWFENYIHTVFIFY